MKEVYYNHWLPRLISKVMPIQAITIWPFILVSGDTISEQTLNHERIHLAQYREMFVVGFLVLYLWDYLGHRISRSHFQSYYNIRFEDEAFCNMRDKYYLANRKPYSWIHYG